MIQAFITIRILDVFDIFLVALLLYQIYQWIKSSVAINIFVGMFAIYLFWLLVKALKMQLLTTILGQFMGVGVLALIIVFQQEIRRFFLHVGSKYFSKNSKFFIDYLNHGDLFSSSDSYANEIISACNSLSKTKTGAFRKNFGTFCKRVTLYLYAKSFCPTKWCTRYFNTSGRFLHFF